MEFPFFAFRPTLSRLRSGLILGHRRSVCSDGSDSAYCLHKIYTGCFLHSEDLGLSIAHCDKCFCRLKDSNLNKNLLYKSVSHSHRGSHVVGDVCLGVDSSKICDGVPDCVGGEDEDFSVCNTKQNSSEKGETRQAKSMDGDGQVYDNSFFLLLSALILVIVIVYVTSLVAACTWCGIRNKRQRDEVELLGGENSTASVGSCSETGDSAVPNVETESVVDVRLTPKSKLNANWNWNCASLLKELGEGFYGSVYLAEEVSGRLVAVKTRNQKVPNCGIVYENELRVLLGIGERRHENVIQLLAYNALSEVLVFEYCQNGNLKSYLKENRSHFLCELDPVYRESHRSTTYRESGASTVSTGLTATDTVPGSVAGSRMSSCQSLNHLPVSEFLASLHGKLETNSLARGTSPAASGITGTLRRQRLTTSRLTKWAKEIASGMAFISARNIVHGDLALRNVLLTQADQVKISDFGLSRNEQSPRASFKKSLPVAWMAPECLRGNSCSKSGDVWAYGITLWEMFSLGKAPYEGEETYVHLDDLGGWLEDGHRLVPPPHIPKSLEAVMLSCWEGRPELRPSFRTIVETQRTSGVGRRMPATLPRSLRARTADSGVSLSPPSLAYLPMDRLGRCAEEREERAATSSVGGGSVSVCYWNGYKIMSGNHYDMDLI